MPRYRILTEADREKMLADLKRAPLEHNGRRGFNVTATRRTRTHEQNDLLWDLLTAFEEQCEMGGRKFNKEAWKVIFMNALGHPSNMLPTLDGESFFAEGYRSSKLSVGQMTELIDYIFAEGAERGIKFKQEAPRVSEERKDQGS